MSDSYQKKPAISLAAIAGRRRATLEIAQEIERRGFSGIYCPSFGDALGLCEALALVTKTIRFGTAIVNIYTRHAQDYARTASLVHELSGGRFDFGIGVSHAPVNAHYGVKTGKPTDDIRRFVADLQKGADGWGELPPIVLATLRKPMVDLARELGTGSVWANAARSHVGKSLSHLSDEQRTSERFFLGNMIPTCISDDRDAAAAVLRKTLKMYVALPNYRNYYREAGYEPEELLGDRWLEDVTLFGPASKVREGVEAWYEAGIRTPILVPSSTSGGQMKALDELIGAFS